MEIIIFAAITAYIFYRLFGVLGSKNYNNKTNNTQNIFTDTEIKKSEEIVLEQDQFISLDGITSNENVYEKAKELSKLDKNFNINEFIQNAKNAFRHIVIAYNDANLDTLEALLSHDLFVKLSNIQKNNNNINILSIEAEIQDINISNDKLMIVVCFRSKQQINDNISWLIDNWTFEKLRNENTEVWRLCLISKPH